MKGKYVYGFSDDNFWSEQYDTAGQALEAARKQAKADGAAKHETVYIGVVGENWEPEIDGEGIIEMMQEMADEEVGDAAANYLENVPEEDVKELTDALTKTFKEWAAKNGYVPTFYTVEHIEEYKMWA